MIKWSQNEQMLSAEVALAPDAYRLAFREVDDFDANGKPMARGVIPGCRLGDGFDLTALSREGLPRAIDSVIYAYVDRAPRRAPIWC